MSGIISAFHPFTEKATNCPAQSVSATPLCNTLEKTIEKINALEERATFFPDAPPSAKAVTVLDQRHNPFAAYFAAEEAEVWGK